MKILKYILSAAALLSFAAACNHDPDEITLSSSDPVITSHGDVVVNDLTVHEDFTLVWSPARFDAQSATTYTVAAKTTGDFVMLGSTSACTYSCKNSDLFAALGIRLTGEYPVTFRVTAESAAGATKEAKTAVVMFEYSKITYLWAFGDYQEWKIDGAGPVSRLLQGRDGLFKGFVQITDAGSHQFKLSSQPNWGGTSYGPGVTDGTLISEGAGNFTMNPGLYYLQVDVDAMTYVALPLTTVSLIGEAVGGWGDGDDVEMTYDTTAKRWMAIGNIKSGKEYKVRFNKQWNIKVGSTEYDCSLGAPANDLQIKGSVNLTAEGDGVTAFTLSLFDYPYTIKEGAVSENEEVLYVANSGSSWNYLKAISMQPLYDSEKSFTNTFCGLLQLPASGEYLFSRLQSPLGTRYGGAADALVKYPSGATAVNLSATQGLSYLYADLNEATMHSTKIPITSVGVVGVINGWDQTHPVEFTYEAASARWTCNTTFPADGEFKMVFNKAWNVEVDGVTHQLTLGGSCTNLRINGGNLYMTKGNHQLVLDLTKSPFTLSIDGVVADLSPNPDYLELTGAFANYNWNLGDASPRLNPYKDDTHYAGFVDMYKPATAEGTEFEFKVTYPEWSIWLGGKLQPSTTYAYDISATSGDNMKLGYGLYFWSVALDAQNKSGVATATAMQSVGLIGTVNGTNWSQDFNMTAAGNGIYTLDATIDSQFKVRMHEANFTNDTAWSYNLGLATEATLVLGKETVLVPDGGGNLVVPAAGTYTITLNLSKSPNTIKIVSK